ncbi:hypothetical protein VTJ49DRAFT_347 [Mycothermus thermophilus]|uniref:JmjC domain-containing protein n=1 Tax=Humicola insolens TaxID=85995 RepID=A0ABR3VHE8_HUMIN
MPPAQHPQAKFDPIPPDLDLHALVERTPNFHWVLRVSAAQIRNLGPQEFERLVYLHVIHGGKPLVIEKWNDRLPKSLFSAEWLEKTYNKKPENVRDLVAQTDIPMTIGHYLRSMKLLTNLLTPTTFRDERRQRLYLKDIDCPPEWYEHLKRVIPPNLFYMNENVEERAGKRRGDADDVFPEGHTPAPAGDLMSSLPEEMRAQNLMCYIGHEGTYTPAHREMCASLGQNIMVDASGDENDEKPGSSIWFMTETKDREVVGEYFLSMLGHDIEIEKHFAQINAWKKATFPVYIVEQKVGDFILVPPLAPHQVWNRGTRTIKVAWNRTTVETLQMALHEALPKARLVCRDEQYKNKAIIYFTLDKYYREMVQAEKTADISFLGFGQDLIKSSARMKQMAADFKALFRLYTEILLDEMFATREKEVDFIEYDSNITCSYCRANIFNRFLTCKHCVRKLVNGDDDTYDICMECYCMGRSCFCVSNLSWCEQWRWSDLVDRYDAWRALIIKNDGYISLDSSPLPLELARKRLGKKSVAQICQEQLRMRPFNDITQVKVKPPSEDEETDVEVDDNGRVKKKKKSRRKKKQGDVWRCHVCQHKDYRYKLAFCKTPGCNEAYCYGVLYRAFDMMPQDAMQDEFWQCPKCRKICNCGYCRRVGNGTPYIPKNTLLGHDTRRIADDRSVESLVDFRVHNLSWLKSLDESRSLSSKRMQRLQKLAEAEKAKQQVDLAQALPNGAMPESTMGAAMGNQTVADGYGAPPDNASPGVAPIGEYGAAPEIANGQQPHPYPNSTHAPLADMSGGESQDQSSYPDPSALGRERMLGMGYYEQDDSPDRILFDPYQAPPPDAMVIDDEPEMPEYLKKQLRIAKRRAKHEEEDDPDFRGPKSYRKKPKLDHAPHRDPQEIALSNMDPALFGDGEAAAGAVGPAQADQPGPVDAVVAAQTATQPADGATAADESREPRSPSPHRPTLRHARPKISYVVDEQAEDEFDEIVEPRPQPEKPTPSTAQDTQAIAENAGKDPLDLASAAIFAMTGGNATPATQDPTIQPAPAKKRGPATASTGKRRGRPPRARMSLDAGSDAPEDDIDAQLAEQLDAFDENGDVVAPKQSESAEPRRRGRPSSRKPEGEAAQPHIPNNIAVEIPYMSLADKMRLRGKKVRIGQRKSTRPTAPATPASQTAARDSSTTETREASAESDYTPGRAATRGRGNSGDGDFDPNAEEEPVSDEERRRSRSPGRSPSVLEEPEAMPSRRTKSVSGATSASDTPTPVSAARSTGAASVSPADKSRSPEPMDVEEQHLDDISPSVEREAEPSPPPVPRVPAGPTIVRLGDLDDDEFFSDGDYNDDQSGQSQNDNLFHL